MQLQLRRTETVQYFSEREETQPEYRRTTTGQWASRFGEAWGPMNDVAGLESALQQWQRQDHFTHLASQTVTDAPELLHTIPL